MSELAPGREHAARYPVTPDMSPPHLAPAQVLGSSVLVELMERTALESVAAAIPAGRTTVGTLIRLEHRRPAFPGEQLKVRSMLVGVGRRLVFDIEAAVGERLVGRARHERAVVDPLRFADTRDAS